MVTQEMRTRASAIHGDNGRVIRGKPNKWLDNYEASKLRELLDRRQIEALALIVNNGPNFPPASREHLQYVFDELVELGLATWIIWDASGHRRVAATVVGFLVLAPNGAPGPLAEYKLLRSSLDELTANELEQRFQLEESMATDVMKVAMKTQAAMTRAANVEPPAISVELPNVESEKRTLQQSAIFDDRMICGHGYFDPCPVCEGTVPDPRGK